MGFRTVGWGRTVFVAAREWVMSARSFIVWALAPAAACVAGVASPAALGGSVPITSDSAHSTEGVGSFTGSLAYDPITMLLSISLRNTTGSGFITAVVFNIMSADASAHATLQSAPNASWADLGTNVPAAPFPNFDAGAAVGGSFNGGGDPSPGIANGVTGILVFKIIASDAASLDPFDFISTSNGTNMADFVVRVRGISGNPDSDKVPALPGVPTPAAAGLGALGLGLTAIRRRRRATR